MPADCRFDRESRLKTLVRKGADINALPHLGIARAATALQHAVRNGSLDMVRYLVEHNADVNQSAAPLGGATALQYAALYGFLAIAEYLIRHGADNIASPAKTDGRTALEAAAEHGRTDMIQLLLNHTEEYAEGHRPSTQRACELVETNGHFAIRDLIMGHFN